MALNGNLERVAGTKDHEELPIKSVVQPCLLTITLFESLVASASHNAHWTLPARPRPGFLRRNCEKEGWKVEVGGRGVQTRRDRQAKQGGGYSSASCRKPRWNESEYRGVASSRRTQAQGVYAARFMPYSRSLASARGRAGL